MKKLFLTSALSAAMFMTATTANAADYVIDTKGAHAFVNFKIKHLGYSWLHGRFNSFDGKFNYDAKNPNASQISVNIDTASLDSNHAERDKHLREKFLETDKFPDASFKSTSFKQQDDGSLVVTGDFTLHGVTHELSFPVEKVGEGEDPWGGYRAGFVGETEFTISDYGINVDMLGPSSQVVYLTLSIEGIKQ